MGADRMKPCPDGSRVLCVDNSHKADWLREMNQMEHDCDEIKRDNRFELTGYPYARQIGGNHYAKYVIQPADYIIRNKLNFCGSNMGTNSVDNAHKADWIREMNAMEHEDESRKDNRFNLTGWPYEVEEPAKPYSRQIGGDHYSKYAIQPTEYIIKNRLNFCEGNVVKYITRWKDKGGIDDLRKAKHYIEMLIETEEM